MYEVIASPGVGEGAWIVIPPPTLRKISSWYA
jgi:hypothetical protein